MKSGGVKVKNLVTVGDKWTAFESIRFGQVSQPYYVLLSPDEILLNKPVGYTPDAVEFAEWLKCGTNAMDKIKSGAYVFGGVKSTGVVAVEEVKAIKWSGAATKNADGTYTLEIQADLQKGWHTYSQFVDPMAGPVPTELKLVDADKILEISKFEEIGAHSHYDSIWSATILDFSDKALFKASVKFKEPIASSVKASVYYMICNDEMCLPPSEEFIEIVIKP